MAGRASEHDGIAEERFVFDTAMTRGRTDDSQFERPVGNALHDGLGVEDTEGDPKFRVFLSELTQELRKDDSTGPRRGPDLETACKLPAVLVGEIIDDVLFELEKAQGAAVQPKAGLRWFHAPPRPVEQLGPEALLERPYLQGHSRLRDAEPLRGVREGLAFDDLAERPQLTSFHKASLYMAKALASTWLCGTPARREYPGHFESCRYYTV